MPSPSNGLTFCTGSLGVRADNDLVAMFGVMPAAVRKMRRQAAERADHAMPMRPDHDHQTLDDLTKHTNPGYPAHRPPARAGRAARPGIGHCPLVGLIRCG